MTRWLWFPVLLLVLLQGAVSFGYDEITHVHIATEAIALSSDASTNPDVRIATIAAQVVNGAHDADTKFYNQGIWQDDLLGRTAPRDHFYNPDNGEALFPTVYTAYQKAVEYWYLATTMYKTNKSQAYYILGHVAHLLADMSVPAHVLVDQHIPPYNDSYEVFCAKQTNYSRWTRTSVKGKVKVASSTLDLFDNLAQRAQYFPSDDLTGNVISTDSSWFVNFPSAATMRIDQNNAICTRTSSWADTGCYVNDDSVRQIGDTMVPLAIEYTASLLNLFYAEMNNPASGLTFTGVLSVPGQVDRRSFTVTAPGRYVIYTRGMTNTTGKLYDANNHLVGGIYQDEGELGNFRMEQVLYVPGTYYIEVSPAYSDTLGSYILHIDGPGAGTTADRDDHGMSVWNATSVPVGSVTPGRIDLPGDRDFFRFTVTAPGRYVIYTRGTTNTTGRLYDANYNLVNGIYQDGGELANFRMEHVLNAPGTYYVEVSPAFDDTVGSYTLHIDGRGAGSTADRDDHGMSAWNATAVAAGAVTSGAFDVVGDRDFFKFTVATPGRYVIYTRGTTNTTGKLYDANYNLVGGIYQDGGELDNFRMEHVLIAPGTYYVEVSPAFSDTLGSYTLHIDAPGAGTTGDRDDHGMSAWNATSVALGAATSGTLNLPGDMDFFRFTVTTPGIYDVYTRGTTNTTGKLYDAWYNLVGGIYQSGGELDNFRFQLALNAPGSYYVEVSPAFNDITGDYTLHINGPLDAAPPVITSFSLPATAISATVPIITFSATDNVKVTGYYLSTSWTLPNPYGTGWSATPPASYTFSGLSAGLSTLKTLYAFVKDAAGNVSPAKSDWVVVTRSGDITRPLISAFSIPATSISATVPITTFAVGDNVGVTGYYLSTTATPPDPYAAGWTTTKPTSYTFSGLASGVPTAKTLYSFVKDAANNISFYRSAAVTITKSGDLTKPVITAFGMPATSISATVPITALTATDNVKVTGYFLSTSPSLPDAYAVGWSAGRPLSFTFTNLVQGVATTKTLYAFVKDAANNISFYKSVKTTITKSGDLSRPVIGSFTIPATSISATIPIVTLAASDNAAVTGYFLTTSSTTPDPYAPGWTPVKPLSYTFTGLAAGVPTVKTLHAFVKDAANNISLYRSASTTITRSSDTTPPSIISFTLPVTSTSATVPITGFTATDNVAVSGYFLSLTPATPNPYAVGWTSTKPTRYTFAGLATGTATTKALYAFVKDRANNVSVSKGAITTITIPKTTAKATVVEQRQPTLALSTLPEGAVTDSPVLNISGISRTGGTLLINSKAVTLASDGAFTSAFPLASGLNMITLAGTGADGSVFTETRRITLSNDVPAIDITEPADNSSISDSFITIRGNTREESTVATSTDGGSWQFAAGSGNSFESTHYLHEGINTLLIKASDASGNVATMKRSINYDPWKPSLAITAPDADMTTATGTYLLRGQVKDVFTPVTVKLAVDGNETEVSVTKDGLFEKLITFVEEKQYQITVTATDQSNATARTTRNIIYRKAR